MIERDLPLDVVRIVVGARDRERWRPSRAFFSGHTASRVSASDQAGLPAELKHINKRRKRN